jgi:hypothetical protein
MTHDMELVSGGCNCNHSLYECRRCGRQVTDIHEYPDGYTERNLSDALREPCSPQAKAGDQ